MKDMTVVETFLQEAKRRLIEMEQAQVQSEAMEIARNRTAWAKILDKVKNQLPDVLKDFVVVTDPDQMDDYPTSKKHFQYFELQIPFCAPISLHNQPGSWKIDTYWPRQAICIEEDINGEPYLRSVAIRGYEDIYIAAAYAHESYPVWKKLEDELDWRLEGKVSTETTNDEGDEVELDWSKCYPKTKFTKLADLLA